MNERVRFFKCEGAIRFFKYEGAGNDFVLLDDPPARLSTAAIRRLLDRHRGIGGDGILRMQTMPAGSRQSRAQDNARFDLPVVSYHNADGGRAAFCGNGARCVALHLIRSTGDREVSFRFGRSRLTGRLAGGSQDPAGFSGPGPQRIAIQLPLPRELSWPAAPIPLPAPLRRTLQSPPAWVDSGVPHLLLHVEDVDAVDLSRIAPPARAWPGGGGTNVDFFDIRGSRARVRTWERGVEGETLACGSGLAAVAFHIGVGLGAARVPRAASGQRGPKDVRLESRGGDSFVFRVAGRSCWLEGPARRVFEGRIELP